MSNATNSTVSAEQLQFIMSGVVSSIICLVGITGNFLNIAVLLRLMKRTVSPTYNMLLALAVSDLFVMTIFATTAFTLFARQPPIIHPHDMPTDASNFHILLYYTWHIAGNTAACASNWLIVVVTLLRFLAVQFPMKVGVWCTAGKVRLAIAAVCILSAALVLPDSMTVGFKLEGGRLVGYETSLYVDATYNAVYYTLQTCVIHLVPYTCNCVLAVLLIRTLRRANQTLVKSTSQSSKGRERDQRRVSIMLVSLVASSLVLTLPSCSYRVARDLFGARGRSDENSQSFVVFRAVCDVLELSNYAQNFYLFCLCNSTYRNKFFAVITCRKEREGRTALSQEHRSSSGHGNEHSNLVTNTECAGSTCSDQELCRKQARRGEECGDRDQRKLNAHVNHGS